MLIQEGSCATICLNRPAYHNRLEIEDIRILSELIQKIETDRSIRVLILTGVGKTFSSGYDISAMRGAAMDPNRLEDTQRGELAFGSLCDQVENIRIPTICALNGPVYGGSTDLALACDFRIGIEGIRMFMPAARLGIHFYHSGLRRYVSRLGLAAAKRLFLTAQPLEAEDMLRIGFLDEIVAAGLLEERVKALAELLAENAPSAVTGMKQALNQISRGEDCRAQVDATFVASFSSDEFIEGMAAWAERRKPNFEGC